MPDSKKCFTEELKIRYDLDCCQPAAKFGEMMRIGRVAPGMGLSWNPHLCIHWPGSWNGPTGYGGGGTFPPQDWQWGTPIPWRRKPLTVEFYNVAGCSETLMQLHQSYGLSEDQLVQAVNQGFPTAVSWALDSSLGQWLQAQGAPMDMPPRAQAPHEYVVKRGWFPGAAGARVASGVAGPHNSPSALAIAEPTASDCRHILQTRYVDPARAACGEAPRMS